MDFLSSIYGMAWLCDKFEKREHMPRIIAYK